MQKKNKAVRRLLAGVGVAVAVGAGALALPTTASAAPAPADAGTSAPASVQAFTCTVRTIGVPVYDRPYPEGGRIIAWVGTGQKTDVTVIDRTGYWYGGVLWGGPFGFIHKNYLNC
jgi:hypothetical protein